MKKFAALLALAMPLSCFAMAPSSENAPVKCESGQVEARTVFAYTSRSLFGDSNPNTIARFRTSDGAGMAESLHCVAHEIKSVADWKYLRDLIITENKNIHDITIVSTSLITQ
ncbi:hypothetical protein RYA05_02500 [Pseudomonas syringae pv. actinidiae]|nr:hypothetical protein [Pseudomonas syringae pv. actinidiae]